MATAPVLPLPPNPNKTVADLGRAWKSLHPEYSDMEDADIGAKVKLKAQRDHSGAYDDYQDMPPHQTYGQAEKPPSDIERTAKAGWEGLKNTVGGTLSTVGGLMPFMPPEEQAKSLSDIGGSMLPWLGNPTPYGPDHPGLNITHGVPFLGPAAAQVASDWMSPEHRKPEAIGGAAGNILGMAALGKLGDLAGGYELPASLEKAGKMAKGAAKGAYHGAVDLPSRFHVPLHEAPLSPYAEFMQSVPLLPVAIGGTMGRYLTGAFGPGAAEVGTILGASLPILKGAWKGAKAGAAQYAAENPVPRPVPPVWEGSPEPGLIPPPGMGANPVTSIPSSGLPSGRPYVKLTPESRTPAWSGMPEPQMPETPPITSIPQAKSFGTQRSPGGLGKQVAPEPIPKTPEEIKAWMEKKGIAPLTPPPVKAVKVPEGAPTRYGEVRPGEGEQFFSSTLHGDIHGLGQQVFGRKGLHEKLHDIGTERYNVGSLKDLTDVQRADFVKYLKGELEKQLKH